MPSTDTRLALVFQLSETQWDTDRATLQVNVRQIGADGDIGYGWNPDFNAIEDFQVDMRLERDNPPAFSTYNVNFGFEPKSYRTVNESEAERYYKALKSLRVKLDRMLEYGQPGSFGALVARTAKALGIKWIGFYPPVGRSLWASGYHFQLDNLADGAQHIDSLANQWRERTGQYTPKESVA